MEFCHRFISIRTPSIIHRTRKPYISFCNSPESQRIRISETLHNETLKTLEWDSICRQLSAFPSTTMASTAARNGNVRLGRSRDESQKLLDQTTAAVLFSRPLDFSGIEDVSEIVDSAVGGELVTVGELCAVKRTLKSARDALEQLEDGERSERSIVVVDDVFCIFVGTLENICDLRRHYGLSRQATEAMVVVEAYKVLRDRAPYPPDQVIRDIEGKFAFILFDAKGGTLFTARDRDGSINLQWGMAGDGSLVCSDNPKIITEACGKACAPFPPGCIFMNGSGLMSFDHPLHKVRAIAREDDDGSISAIIFQVDLLTRLPSIPRTGSAANWADAAVVNEE